MAFNEVILIFGVCGALRCDELSKLKVQDVEDRGKKFLVSINQTKNDVARQFVIGEPFYGKVKQYIRMRAQESFTDRFFIKYQNGKFHQQVIGRNKIGETPKSIASFLNLPNPILYTGHCFRRTGATLLSDSGANETMLKQLGGWKSTAIAQGYVENSMKNRERIYEGITRASEFSRTNPQPSTSTDQQPSTSTNPQPSTSTNPQPTKTDTSTSSAINTTEAEMIIPSNDETSPDGEMDCDYFSDGFEINEEDLFKIDKLEQPKSDCKTLTPVFTTANTKKILVTQNTQSTKPTHFLQKPPVAIFPKKSENVPPGKQPKANGTGIQHHVNGPKSKRFSINSSANENPHNTFENCVFHGNIINNFYYTCDHGKN